MRTEIGVDDACISVDQKHRRRKSVERISQRRRLNLVQINNLANVYGAPEMRHQQPHASARLVVDHAIAMVPGHDDGSRASYRFIKDRIEGIAISLRLRPLLVKS